MFANTRNILAFLFVKKRKSKVLKLNEFEFFLDGPPDGWMISQFYLNINQPRAKGNNNGSMATWLNADSTKLLCKFSFLQRH